MKYLLDTCVLSETTKKSPNFGVVKWLKSCDESNLYISVITFGEIQKGVSKLKDPLRQKQLQSWLDKELIRRFQGQVLELNIDISVQWGICSGESLNRGITIPVIDGLLAATAIHHNLTLVTQNTRDFKSMPVRLHNPWE